METRAKKQNIQKIILNSLYGVGIISLALLAPNILGVLGKYANRRSQRYRVNRSVNRLIEGGFLKFENTPKGKFVRLTPKGEKKIEMLYAGETIFKKPRRWDGKWRIVTYDLKGNKNLLRNKLRDTLIAVGFIKLQKSVWIYPYECEDLINLIKADFKIGREILYVVAERVEGDKWLKEAFDVT